MNWIYTSVLTVVCISAQAQVEISKFVKTQPPNVASFEKYGNIPLNYSTGQVSYSIPLYSFGIDENITIPINLNYSNSGLKPDEIPSWVGHGWDLMVGGYITQNIRGIDDFSITGMSAQSAKEGVSRFLKGEMNDNQKQEYIKNVFDGKQDSQFDIFSINFLGQSSKFFFDGKEIVFVQYKPFKASFLDNKFTVTDEKGYKFIFDNNITNSGTYKDEPSDELFQTNSRTWYLSKIITPYNNEIIFEYDIDVDYKINSDGASFNFGATYVNSSLGNYCTAVNGGISLSNSVSEVKQLILRKFAYKNRKVEFTTRERNDIIGNQERKGKYLSSIRVTDEKDKITNEIKFSYVNEKRLGLTKVSFLKKEGTEEEQSFAFEYYKAPIEDLYKDFFNVPLVTANSPYYSSAGRTYAIDHWGYYNGAVSNNFKNIPKVDYTNLMLTNLTNTGVFGENERGSKGEYSKMGMLRRIEYPTGGYTEIEYEPNKVFYKNISDVPWLFKSDISLPYSKITESMATCTSGGTKYGTFKVTESTDNAKLNWYFSSKTDLSILNTCYLRLKKSGEADEIYRSGENEQKTNYISLTVGTYEYEISPGCILGDYENSATNFASFSIEVSPNGNIPVIVGGNRVKRIIDAGRTNAPNAERLFLYEEETLRNFPIYFTKSNVWRPLGQYAFEDCGTQYTLGGTNLSSWDGYHIDYKKITELLGVESANGKTIYYYNDPSFFGGGFNIDPFPPIMNLSWRNGTLARKEIYEKKRGVFFLKKKYEYQYTNTPAGTIPVRYNGVKFGIAVKSPFVISNRLDEIYKYALVTINGSDRFNQKAVTEIDYSDNAEFSRKEINYEYTPDYFLLRRSSTINSIGGNEQQYNWYPNDFDETIPDANILPLKSANVIGLPLKSIKATNGRLTSGEVYRRNVTGSIAEAYLAENVIPQSLPSHDPSVFVPPGFALRQTIKYTSDNNIREQSKSNDLPTAYLWGYNTSYPVAEIKNATYEQVKAALGISTPGDVDLGVGGLTPAQVTALRTNLLGAMVTTYVYEPLVGMTSSTDPAGVTTTYEYDGFQRLSLVRDQDGNILKQYQYNYRKPD